MPVGCLRFLISFLYYSISSWRSLIVRVLRIISCLSLWCLKGFWIEGSLISPLSSAFGLIFLLTKRILLWEGKGVSWIVKVWGVSGITRLSLTFWLILSMKAWSIWGFSWNFLDNWYHRHPGQGHVQWKHELCHDSKQRRGLENTKDIQQWNLKRRNQKLVSS